MTANVTLSSLIPQTRQVLLRELVAADGEYIHVRELERRTGAYSANLSRELRKLKAGGIVESRRVGRQLHYRLDERCPIYRELRSIIIKTVGIAGPLKDALAPLAKKLKLVYVYGSFADGTAGAESDVDLMVVGRASLLEVVEAMAEASDRLSREINPTVYSGKEYRAELASSEGFVYEVHHGAKILLIGEPDETE